MSYRFQHIVKSIGIEFKAYHSLEQATARLDIVNSDVALPHEMMENPFLDFIKEPLIIIIHHFLDKWGHHFEDLRTSQRASTNFGQFFE